MQDPSVQRLFQEQLKYYSRRDQSAGASPVISLFLDWAKKKERLNICEFGGGAGLLLAKLQQKFPNFSYTNVEIIKGYRKSQVSKKIKFIHGSILKSNFPDKSFDCLIIRDVLHHLIGRNFRETSANQKRALKELWRLLNSSGVIFIEELVNNSALACRLIYWLSKINTKIGFRIPTLEITPYTVLVFLTPKKMIEMCRKVFGKDQIKKINYIPEPNVWQIRLVHLGARCGKMFIAVGKNA